MNHFKKRRLTASDCEALSSSPEGTFSLTQPLGQRPSSQDPNKGLYPTHWTRKHPRGGRVALQKSLTEYFRKKGRASEFTGNMAAGSKTEPEASLGSLTAQDDPFDTKDSISLCGVEENADAEAAPKRSRFSWDTSSTPVDCAQQKQDEKPLLLSSPEWPRNHVNIKQEVEDMEVEPVPDACYGLLGTRHWAVPQGCIDQLPDEVLREIFTFVPAVDLYRNVSLVCRRWQQIVADPQFIPWRKRYHQYLKAEENATLKVQEILQQYKLIPQKNECMLLFLRCVASLNKHHCREPVAILNCLKRHPLFPKAEICVARRLLNVESPEAEPFYVSAVMMAIVLFAGGVGDVQTMMACLRRPNSALSHRDITEVLYCAATLLYAMRENQVRISNRIHYNIFYSLYHLENLDINAAVIKPELSSRGHGCGLGGSSNPGIQPTSEQQQILNHAIAPGQVVKIVAFAGTGKTSTLAKYAEKWSNYRFLYLAFNKTIAEQGSQSFPKNVTCKTIHSLAFAEVGKNYKQKLNVGSLTSYWVSYVLQNREGESRYVRAKMVTQTLSAFLASPDESITLEHAPIWCKNTAGRIVAVEREEKEIVVDEARQIWTQMQRLGPTPEMAHKMTHDGYLKLWQLQKPSLSSCYDAIFVDEAQDCTPAIMDIILSQSCCVILVGDPHQQIYTFRGAVNAMSEVPHTHVFYLTQSFRFGSEIAYIGATILDVCKNVRKKTLVGSNSEGDVSGTEATGTVACLSRNNLTVFEDAVNFTSGENPAKIHLLGGLEAFGLKKIHDLWKLLHHELRSEVKDPFFKRWVEKGFAALKNYAMAAEDKQLEMKIAIVEKYRDRIPELVKKISRCHITSLDADYILGTIHKAKGMEFNTVRVAGDFASGMGTFLAQHAFETIPAVDTGKVPDDEWNLLYVAITRAKKCLIMPSFLSDLLAMAGEHFLRPELTSEVCKGTPVTCSVRGCSDAVSSESVLTMKKAPFIYSNGTKDPEGFVCRICTKQRLGPLAWLTMPRNFSEDQMLIPANLVQRFQNEQA
uniref:F-box DNA helicase 1 n=1 Tax=Salvator merianae TaxID=96440 RepID=A0A8D0BK48_SALMN